MLGIGLVPFIRGIREPTVSKESLEGGQEEPKPEGSTAGRPCPHCQAPMRREAGCFVCDKCQFSSCG